MTVRDTADIEVLSWIPIDAWTILDVGCGEGDLGAEYKRRNPRAKIYGIETSEAAAQRARYRLDRVYTSDININPLPFANDVAAGTFDCLIYNGVLNKLLNPWTVLQRHVEFLAADGTVLVCGKNFEHWSIAERLLKGNLCYEREGSLESGRLRWFTAEGVKQLLHDCGLMSVECEPQTSDHQEAASFAELVGSWLERTRHRPCGLPSPRRTHTPCVASSASTQSHSKVDHSLDNAEPSRWSERRARRRANASTQSGPWFGDQHHNQH